MKRVFLIVMDSVGIGAQKDAAKYGDDGSDTLGNLYAECDMLKLNNLIKLGLGNIDDVHIPKRTDAPIGAYGKCAEKSKGKDTSKRTLGNCGG